MKMAKQQLLDVLDALKAAVAADDSFEGSIEYSAMADGLGHGEFEVSGAYRIGNSMGQGGMRVFERTPFDPVPSDFDDRRAAVWMAGPPEAVEQDSYSDGPSRLVSDIIPTMNVGDVIVGKDRTGAITVREALQEDGSFVAWEPPAPSPRRG